MPDSIVERIGTGRVNAFQNPLPGVPHVESPFFDDIFASMEIDGDLMRVARDLHEFGYAIIDFPDPGIGARAERIKQALYPRYDWQRWRQGGAGLRLQDAFHDNADVRAVAVNPTILDILGTLYGRRAFPFQTLNFPVGTQQPFHTDSVHFSCVPERFMCGVWVALEDVGPDQGPLIYYPGSHRWPIYVNEHIGAAAAEVKNQGAYEPLWRELVRVSGIEERRFAAKRGQALIWTANLLHGGAPQANPDLTRWSQVTHYYFDDCAYYTPMFSDPFMGKIHFRQPADIAAGGTVTNKCHGAEIAVAFLRSMTKARSSTPTNSMRRAISPIIPTSPPPTWTRGRIIGDLAGTRAARCGACPADPSVAAGDRSSLRPIVEGGGATDIRAGARRPGARNPRCRVTPETACRPRPPIWRRSSATG